MAGEGVVGAGACRRGGRAARRAARRSRRARPGGGRAGARTCVIGSVPDARPRPRSIRPGYRPASRLKASATFSGRVVREHHAAAADADPARGRGDRPDQHLGRRAGEHRAAVVLGDPVAVVAELVGEPGEVERVAQRVGPRRARADRGLVQDAQAHRQDDREHRRVSRTGKPGIAVRMAVPISTTTPGRARARRAAALEPGGARARAADGGRARSRCGSGSRSGCSGWRPR